MSGTVRSMLGRGRRALRRLLRRAPVPPPKTRAGGLISLVGPALARSSAAHVAVVCDDETAWFENALAARHPRARVTRLAAGDPQLHVDAAAAAPFDAIIDTVHDAPAERAQRVRNTLPHLRDRGVFVVEHVRAQEEKARKAGARKYERLLAEGLAQGIAGAAPMKPLRFVRSPLALGSATIRGRNLVLTHVRPPFATIREDEIRRYLQQRPDCGTILVEHPGTTLDSPAPPRESASDDAPAQPTHFEAPPVQLREYHDVVCWPGQIVQQRNVLLPESFRHTARPTVGNSFTERIDTRFGRIRESRTPQSLDGVYFHLDSEYRGHFGHAMTEQISRLWAWDEAKKRHPELKALLLTNRFRTELYDWEYRLYEAYGIARSDLVLVDGPARVKTLLGATPMFSQPEYVHTGVRDIHRRIGDDLVTDAPDRSYPDRIFCSRRNDKRSCTNLDEVEAFFADRGFDVVYPEDYPLGEQVAMFRAASLIAGFAGSAMFTVEFVPEPTHVITVASEKYAAWNEDLLCAVHGHQLDIAWCRPDPDAENSGGEAIQAPFTFDSAREGAFLREILGE